VTFSGREGDQGLAQAILAQAADAVIFADPEGVIRIWNAAAARIFGFTAEETVGNSLDLIIPDRLRPAHWTAFRRAMQSGTARLEARPTLTRGLHKSGRRLYVEMSFAVVRAPSGLVAGSVAIARDVTQRQEEERQRQWGTGSSGSSTPAAGTAQQS
jgi:PAS domain S-box-containing protein